MRRFAIESQRTRQATLPVSSISSRRNHVHRITRLARLAVALALAGAATAAHAVTEIQWWHAMTGAQQRPRQRARQALQRQPERLQGQRRSTRAAIPKRWPRAIAAFRAGNAPHILQVFEVGTATMMAAKGAIKPVYEVMARGRREVRSRRPTCPRSPATTRTPKGQMLSFPFNSSTTVFYYNKDAFEKAGLDPEPAAADVAGSRRRDGQAEGRRATRARSRPAGSRGRSSRASRAWHNVPFATEGERLRRHRRRSSCSTARCRCATSRTCRTGSRRATSSTAAARTSRKRSSTAANAR